jgi:co-chaperonin GroES (HSP10)
VVLAQQENKEYIMIKPIRDNIAIVFEAPETETDSGIQLPEGVKLNRDPIGVIVAIGPKVDESLQLKVGDKVLLDLAYAQKLGEYGEIVIVPADGIAGVLE